MQPVLGAIYAPIKYVAREQCRQATFSSKKSSHVQAARLSFHTSRCRVRFVASATESSNVPVPEGEEDDKDSGQLLPEDDWVVPGTYEDAMKSGTKLGKAIQGACEELATLGSIESEVLNEAQELLKSVGFKGSLFQAPPSVAQEEGGEEKGAPPDGDSNQAGPNAGPGGGLEGANGS